MFSKFFKKKEAPARRLEHPKDLRINDIITFKPRSVLPEELQGTTLTVKKVTCYEYSDGLSPEFTLETAEGKIYSFTYDTEDDGDFLCISRALSHEEIVSAFDEEQLGELWSEEFPTLETRELEAPLSQWLGEAYRQTLKETTAYFYDEDRRGKAPSEFVDPNAQELRYHECEGTPDQFSLNVEIWEDGDTDIYAQVSVPLNVIEEMWPNGD